jgi:hypothetical protein
MSHRLENLEISKVTVAAAARFTFFYYRRGAVHIFLLPSRRGSNFSFSVAARQRQMFSRDGHL